MGYLMYKHRVGYSEALRIAQSRRSVIHPYHRGLLDVLERYQEKHGFGATNGEKDQGKGEA